MGLFIVTVHKQKSRIIDVHRRHWKAKEALKKLAKQYTLCNDAKELAACLKSKKSAVILTKITDDNFTIVTK